MAGPAGMSMEEPQNVGSPMIYVPENANNRGSQSCVVAWSFWKHFMGTVLNQAHMDLDFLPENPQGPYGV